MAAMKKKRTFHAASFKVKVLDHVADLGSVSLAAQRHQLEPNIIYSWQRAEKDIRKVAAREAREALRTQKPSLPGLVKKPAPPRIEMGAAPGVVPPEPAHPDGPEVAVRALGPWLQAVVKKELPIALDGQLERLVAERMAAIETKITALVQAELKAFVQKGISGE